MKNFIIRICCITLCIVTAFCFASCKDNSSSSSSESTSVVEEISPIKDLLSAIKKNPAKYNNKPTFLKGTILKENGKTILLDYHDCIEPKPSGSSITSSSILKEFEERKKAKGKPSIEVVLLDNIQSYVVESWDYVKIKGMVKITSEKIYLDKCECTIILSHDERW